MKYIDVVIKDISPWGDQPAFEFIDIENEKGKSVRVGEWVIREDGSRAIRIKPEDIHKTRKPK